MLLKLVRYLAQVVKKERTVIGQLAHGIKAGVKAVRNYISYIV